MTYPEGKLTLSNYDPELLREHKAEKGRQCVAAKSESYQSLKELVERAAEVPITPSVLKNGKRGAANFIETKLIVLDIDSAMSLDQALKILENSGYKYAIYTSYSHSVSGKDKFHVIIPIDRIITTIDEYKATYRHASQTLFNSINDDQTCSPANLFFNSNPKTKKTYINEQGIDYPKQMPQKHQPTVPTVTTGKSSKLAKLSRRTRDFLLQGATEGEWHKEFILAVKNLKSAGFTKDEATEQLEKITGTLTDQDLYQIDHGFKDENFNYNVDMIGEIHPLRMRYLTPKGKFLNIPVKEIVDTYCKDEHLIVSISGQCYLNGKVTPISVVTEYIRDFSETSLKQQISKQNILSVFEAIKYNNRLTRFEELKKYIKYDGSSFNWTGLVEAVIGNKDPLIELILKHFVWQVKRKLFSKSVSYHMMPVFVGKSGSGKSMLISKMIDTLKDIAYLDGDFHKLVDTREAFALIDYYIYFVDEMSKAEKSDVESIKNKITSPTIQYRMLGTNSLQTGTNNATFIGASNVEIEHVIKDDTSARRFYQIVTLARMDWKAINELDFYTMWKSVDEEKDQPYILPHIEQIQQNQASFKHTTAIEHFVMEEYPTLTNQLFEGAKSISRGDLYTKYKDYRVQSGYPSSVGKHYFFSQIRSKIGDPDRIRQNNEDKFVYYYKDNKENT